MNLTKTILLINEFIMFTRLEVFEQCVYVTSGTPALTAAREVSLTLTVLFSTFVNLEEIQLKEYKCITIYGK